MVFKLKAAGSFLKWHIKWNPSKSERQRGKLLGLKEEGMGPEPKHLAPSQTPDGS